jgi:hypothetical protein
LQREATWSCRPPRPDIASEARHFG